MSYFIVATSILTLNIDKDEDEHTERIYNCHFSNKLIL